VVTVVTSSSNSRFAAEILLRRSILPRTALKTGCPMAISFSINYGKCK